MRRSEVMAKIGRRAREVGLPVRVTEGAKHSRVRIGETSITTVPRGSHEIASGTARAIFKDLEPDLGEGWWR
jgi:hypothetical protein